MQPAPGSSPRPERAEPPHTAEAALDVDLANARILVADDDDLNRRLTCTVLERDGYGVVAVADGERVLHALEGDAVDLLLLDVGLPGLDGLEVTRRLRSDPRYATLPILLLTGRSTEGDVEAGLDAGADEYLTKPIGPGILLARVQTVLRSRRSPQGVESAHAVVAALADAIGARDTLTEAHSQRLGTYGAALAHHVGLSEVELQAVTYGTLLRDVGKIGVPEAVLMKPGRLDADEWELMRRHTEIGERMAAPLPGSARFGPIIRHHHEHWSGRGYPDGLRGEDIPIGARIVGIVDAFDAITQARIYRPARSVVTALEELRQGRGGQFDPDLVDAFLHIVEWGDLADVPGPTDTLSVTRSRPPEPKVATWT